MMGIFAPGAIPASMAANGDFKKEGSDEVVSNPNLYSWGVRNVAAVVPIAVAFALGTRDAWLTAAAAQVFRDLPDTMAEFFIKKDYGTGAAFSLFVIADIACIVWIAGQ